MKYKINLLPEELQPQPVVKLSRLWRVVVVVVMISAISIGYTALVIDLKNKKEMLTTIERELNAVLVAVEKVQQARNLRLESEKMSHQMHSLLVDDIKWHQVLEDINYHLPGGIWLTEVSLNFTEMKIEEEVIIPLEEQQINDVENLLKVNRYLVIKGNSETLALIGLLIYNLQQLSHFEQVELVNCWLHEHADEQLLFIINAALPEGKR